MSINVIEHVYDAFKFLDNLYNALKPGGIIIYHDRYYKTPPDGDGILGFCLYIFWNKYTKLN